MISTSFFKRIRTRRLQTLYRAVCRQPVGKRCNLAAQSNSKTGSSHIRSTGILRTCIPGSGYPQKFLRLLTLLIGSVFLVDIWNCRVYLVNITAKRNSEMGARGNQRIPAAAKLATNPGPVISAAQFGASIMDNRFS